MDILDFIPFGKENAVSRSYLRSVVGINDRQIRAMIRAASTPAHPVVTSAKGYFQPTERDYMAVQAYCRQESARQRSVEDNCRVMRIWLNAHRATEEEMPYGKQMNLLDFIKG